MGMHVQWTVPPDALAEAIRKYGDRVMTAVKALGDAIATQAQNDMRRNAPWRDRTGNARSGLFSLAERAAQDVVIIYFSHGHTIEYGKYLELSRSGRYAIIRPTMERMYPETIRLLNRLFA